MDKVSIIVPIYNAEATLDKCINSIVKQTYKNIEIILINDGSNDKSENICLKYKKKDNRIKYIYKENEGISKTRNKGLKLCTGDYLCWCDSDDYYNENYIKVLYNQMKINKNIVICRSNDFTDLSQMKHIDTDTTNFCEATPKEFIKKVLNEEQFGGVLWNKIFNLDIIKKEKIEFDVNYNIGEDLDFVLKYIDYCTKIEWCSLKLYNHYINSDSITNSNINKRINMWNNEVKLCQKLIDKYKYDSELYECSIRRFCRLNIDLLRKTKDITYKNNLKKYIHQVFKSSNIKLRFKIKLLYYYFGGI